MRTQPAWLDLTPYPPSGPGCFPTEPVGAGGCQAGFIGRVCTIREWEDPFLFVLDGAETRVNVWGHRRQRPPLAIEVDASQQGLLS